MSTDFASDLPAQRLTTHLTKGDLVLQRQAQRQIDQIETWLKNEGAGLEDWADTRKSNSGYRTLFSGPPGTGKTLAATVLGQSTGREVYRIDLSKVLSNYIGETEKNLSRVFDAAEKNGWILFFDEADALFAQRPEVSSRNDRYANQEVAYLLQRIETYPGVAILSINLISGIDEGFLRRFQSIVAFDRPHKGEPKRS